MAGPNCDFDVSSEEEKQLTRRSRARKSGSSLFGLPLEGSAEQARKSNYEQRLLLEATAWNELLRKKVEDIERSAQCHVNIGKDDLTQQQLDYLEEGTSILHKYAAGAEKFSLKTIQYLDQYSEIVEMQDQLTAICQAHLDRASISVIHDCIYSNNFAANLY